MPKRQYTPEPSSTSEITSPRPEKSSKSASDGSPTKSPTKATKISSAVKAEIVDFLFANCSNDSQKVLADKVGLTAQQIKSQFAGGGRANMRKSIVEAIKKGSVA